MKLHSGCVLLVLATALVSCGPKPSPQRPVAQKRGKLVYCDVPSKVSSGDVEPVEKISRYQVQDELKKFKADIKHCGAWRPSGSGTETISFYIVVQPKGYVSVVAPTGKYADTTLGRCGARKLCEARFPPAKGKFTVTYPYKL